MDQGKHSRRHFIGHSAKAGLALTTLSAVPAILSAKNAAPVPYEAPTFEATAFKQDPLGYDYNALEPVIDAKTMEIHYTKHAATYTKNLNEAIEAEKIDASMSLEDIIKKASKYSAKIRNNGGGHYNHEFFWKTLKAGGPEKPSGALLSAIEKDFGSFDDFKTKFTEAGKTRFGSGWAWLVVGPGKKLVIGSTPNQDNPLMDVSELKGYPVLGLDVWEHAYYLTYQNRRPDYIGAWWKVINWDYVQSRFDKNS